MKKSIKRRATERNTAMALEAIQEKTTLAKPAEKWSKSESL
jgi:hypothetical protein